MGLGLDWMVGWDGVKYRAPHGANNKSIPWHHFHGCPPCYKSNYWINILCNYSLCPEPEKISDSTDEEGEKDQEERCCQLQHKYKTHKQQLWNSLKHNTQNTIIKQSENPRHRSAKHILQSATASAQCHFIISNIFKDWRPTHRQGLILGDRICKKITKCSPPSFLSMEGFIV